MVISTENILMTIDGVTECFIADKFSYSKDIKEFGIRLSLAEIKRETGLKVLSDTELNKYMQIAFSIYFLILRGFLVGISEDIYKDAFNLSKLKEKKYLSSIYVKKWEKVAATYKREGGLPLPAEIIEVFKAAVENELIKNSELCGFYTKSKDEVSKYIIRFLEIGYFMYLAK